MYRILCTITGLVPIMFHRFPLPKKPGDNEKKKAQTLKEKMWIDKKGVYIPADNLRMILIGNQKRTGAAKIYGTDYESKKGTKYTNFCKACVWITGYDDPMKVYFHPNRKKHDDTDIRSFINSQGSRNTIERPILKNPWSLTFEIQVTDGSVPEETIRRFYEIGGLRCGLGVYGPTFGRFTVENWKVIKEKATSKKAG